MESLKFSIIIPAYNCEDLVSKCLDSILNQTYKNFEIIVIDDCSTDNTLNILKTYNNYIKIFSTAKNSRQGVARNIGLDNCSGDYILFVDSDDYLSTPDVLYKIYNLITKNGIPDIVYLGMKIEGNRDLILMPDEKNCQKSYRLAENPFINVTSICWKASLIHGHHIRFPENIKYEDVYFSFLGIEKSVSYTYGDFIYYIYYNKPNTTSTSYSLSQAIDTIKLIDKLFELYDLIDSENKKYLDIRIQQQADRVPVRLNRAIKEKLDKIKF